MVRTGTWMLYEGTRIRGSEKEQLLPHSLFQRVFFHVGADTPSMTKGPGDEVGSPSARTETFLQKQQR